MLKPFRSVVLSTLLLFTTNAFALDSSLIIGASVSNNYAAPSPGLLVSWQANLKSEDILIVAEDGQKSSYHDSFIRFMLPQMGFDHIFAIDLFFHDFKNEIDPKADDLQRMENYIAILARHGRQVYLGSAIDWRRLGGATKANVVMKQIADSYPNVHYVDMNGLFAAIYGPTGYDYDINGVQFNVTAKDVMADEIHPNMRGAKLLGNLLIQMMRNRVDGRHARFPYLDISAPSQNH